MLIWFHYPFRNLISFSVVNFEVVISMGENLTKKAQQPVMIMDPRGQPAMMTNQQEHPATATRKVN